MQKKFFPFFFLIALVLPFSSQAEPVDGLLGNWVADGPLRGRDVEFQLSFSFQPEQTQMSVRCLYRDGSSLSIQAMARTEYRGNDIFIMERNQGTANDGYHFCQASLDRSQWNAYFDGTGRLVLFVPVPYQARFFLVREEI